MSDLDTMSMRALVLSLVTIPMATTLFATNHPSPSASPAANTANPLLNESTLPFHYPPFDKIKDGDFQPAIEQGMTEHLKEIEAIANSSDKPSFEQNVLKEKNASSITVDKREDLAGLSDNEISAAAKAAQEEHKDGKFDIRLQNTTGQEVLTSMQNRPLRQQIMEASLARNSK